MSISVFDIGSPVGILHRPAKRPRHTFDETQRAKFMLGLLGRIFEANSAQYDRKQFRWKLDDERDTQLLFDFAFELYFLGGI